MSRRALISLILIHLIAYPAGSLPQAKAADAPLFKSDINCSRTFIYRNRTYSVDSSRKLDGEGLRTVLNKLPQSKQLLDDYQAKLRASFVPAYITTGGVALALGGSIYGGRRDSYLGRRDTTYAFLFSGIFIAVAGYAYGQYAIRDKEKTLEKAVETYNDAVPEPERVRVELIPLPSGDGGEIRTQIPF